MMLIITFLLLAVCYTYFKLGQRHLVKCTENIPGEKTVPLLGNAHSFIRMKNLSDFWIRIKEIIEKFDEEKILKFWFGPFLIVNLWDPSLLEKLSRADLSNKGTLYSKALGHFMNGVFVSDGGERWKELRRPIMKSLAKKTVENDYFKVFSRRCRDFGSFVDEHKVGQYHNVSVLFGNLFLDIFSEALIGVPSDEVRENKFQFVEHLERLFDVTYKSLLKYYLYFWRAVIIFTGESKELHHHMKGTDRFLQWVLDERKTMKSKTEDKEYYPDFLLKRMLDKKLSENDIKKELLDFIMAGSETPTVVTSSAAVYLATNPEIQEKAFLEQSAIFQDSDRDPTQEDLADMVYLDMVVKEAIRKVCPPAIIKYCSADIDVGNYTIPKGCYINIFINALHNDPKNWERPSEFYPEHFLAEKEASRPRYSYIPFGFGARACPGSRYATLSIKTVLSTLLRRFKLSTTLKYEDITYDYSLVLHMSSGYNLKFERRS